MIDLSKGMFHSKLIVAYCAVAVAVLILSIVLGLGGKLVTLSNPSSMSLGHSLDFVFEVFLRPMVIFAVVTSFVVFPVAVLGVVRSLRLRSISMCCQYLVLGSVACVFCWIGFVGGIFFC